MPDLDRVDAMPVRAFAACKQEIDRGRNGTAIDRPGIAKRLAEMSALGMRFEIEQADDFGGGESAHGRAVLSSWRAQNLSLRARMVRMMWAAVRARMVALCFQDGALKTCLCAPGWWQTRFPGSRLPC